MDKFDEKVIGYESTKDRRFIKERAFLFQEDC